MDRTNEVEVMPNLSVKRDCGIGVAAFLNRLRAAAPYLQRYVPY